jgi:hypothetical protein
MANEANLSRGRMAESAPLQIIDIRPSGYRTTMDMRFRALLNSMMSKISNVMLSLPPFDWGTCNVMDLAER